MHVDVGKLAHYLIDDYKIHVPVSLFDWDVGQSTRLIDGYRKAFGMLPTEKVPEKRMDKPPAAIAGAFNDNWTWFDHLQARRGGWLLDNGQGPSRSKGWWIRKSVHTDTFDNDDQARLFVEMLADNGDELALKAMARIMIYRLTGE